MDGMWRGTVTSIDSDGNLWITVPRLRAEPFGPAENLPAALVKGDRCLVASREGRTDQLEIVRKLP